MRVRQAMLPALLAVFSTGARTIAAATLTITGPASLPTGTVTAQYPDGAIPEWTASGGSGAYTFSAKSI